MSKFLTHGDRFLATGGMNLTSDDAFKAAEIWSRKLKVAEMKSDKADRLSLLKKEKEALDILKKEKKLAR